MGVAQLARFPELLGRRLANSALLKSMLPEFNPIGGSYAVSVKVPDGIDRDSVRAKMLTRQVETSVYYKHPVPDMPVYRKLYGEQVCPVAREFCYQRLTLPVGPHLKQSRIELVAAEFRRVLA